MENPFLQKIEVVAGELLNQSAIKQTQKHQLFNDLLNSERLNQLQKIFQQKSLKNFIKLYIQSNYQQKKKRLNYSTLLEKKISKKSTIKQNYALLEKGDIYDTVNAAYESIKDKFQTTIRFLAQMICNRKQKIIQSYLNKLLYLLIESREYSYIKWEKQTPKIKIQYYNSSMNFLTIFLEGQKRYKQIINASFQMKSGIYQYSKHQKQLNILFDIKNKDLKYTCYVIENDEQKILFCLKTEPNSLSFNSGKYQNQQIIQFFEHFITQAIQTLHSSKFQVSNVQITVKAVLNLLVLSIKINQLIIEQKIKRMIREQLKKEDVALQQYLRQLRKTTEGKKDAELIEQAHQRFISKIRKYESRIIMYKLEVSDSFSIYFDINKYGELRFISNKMPISYYKRIQAANKNENDQITVFDLFKQKSEILEYIENAMHGEIFVQPIQIFEDQITSQLKFFYDKQNELKRCEFRLYLKNHKRSEKIFENFTSINTILSTDSEKDMKSQLKAKTGLNQQAKRLLNQLEQETPGVAKNGWLEAFMKNDLMEKYKNKIESKKRIDISIKNLPSTKKRISVFDAISNTPILYNLSQNLLSGIELDSFHLNLLEVNQESFFPIIQTIFNKLNYFHNSGINRGVFLNFLKELKSKYNKHNNPFHNFTHGVSVMHFCYLISKFEKNHTYLSDINRFALVFSGLCHDVGHPGNNNVFEISSYSKKAITYNDRSPLQNYHASKSYKILMKSENNFLAHLKREQFNQIRKQFITNILATDIKEHFPLLANFDNKMKSTKGFEKIPVDIELLTTFIIHTSDFAGASKTFDVSREWATRVNQQFSRQFEKEGQLGIPQTPFMKDLHKEDVMAKNEAGFMKVIVRPLYKSISQYYEEQEILQKILKNIDENVLIWQKIATEAKNRSTN